MPLWELGYVIIRHFLPFLYVRKRTTLPWGVKIIWALPKIKGFLQRLPEDTRDMNERYNMTLTGMLSKADMRCNPPIRDGTNS